MRDDFTDDVKRAVAARVGGWCSRPDCGAVTSGPQVDPAKALNLGVAAHITAASPAGPRFDQSLSAEVRRSVTNAIWLCQSCAKLVDNDPSRFPKDLLLSWKAQAESRALSALGKPSSSYESLESRKRSAILSWKGSPITLSQMNTGRAARLLGPVAGQAEVILEDCNDLYVTIRSTDSSRSIPLGNVDVAFDNKAGRLELQERHA